MSGSGPPSRRAPSPIPVPEGRGIDRLLAVMAALRNPEGGCPWDLEQTFATIAPYTVEEAYEVAGAIAEGDFAALRDELGDLLLQVVYHARMAEEAGRFDFAEVAGGIADKMVRRHPHVFGDRAGAGLPPGAWEAQKAEERARKAAADGRTAGALDGVGAAFPALMRAARLQRRAARVGFDWPDAAPVLAKVAEELDEAAAELAAPPGARDAGAVEDEIGDLLFACANLARHAGVDPETALRRANAKFETRFRAVERMLAEELGVGPEDAGLEEMEARWARAKAAENAKKPL